MVTEYNTIEEIVGPLIFLDDVDHATVEELVEVEGRRFRLSFRRGFGFLHLFVYIFN